jgi:hypothetical protein
MKEFIKVMKALSDPNRVKLVKLLQKGEMCVCKIHAALGIAQPTASFEDSGGCGAGIPEEGRALGALFPDRRRPEPLCGEPSGKYQALDG